MTGTIVNTIAIIAGAVVGVSLKKGISNTIKNTVMQGIGLAVLLVGIQMSLQGSNFIVIIISLVTGGVCGELLRIEHRLEQFGDWLEKKVGGNGGEIARAFVTTSLIYCAGAMSVVGAIEDGIQGNSNTLFAKAMLDGISSIFFASTMGIGVLLSSIPVFIYQGTITLLASTVKSILNPYVINQLTSIGGLLIIGIAFNIFEIKKIKIGNLLPAILFVVPLAYFAQKYNYM